MSAETPTPDPNAPANPPAAPEAKADVPVAEGEPLPGAPAPGATKIGHVQQHDFRNPSLLSPGVIRKMRLHQEEFAQSAAARLSIHLRSEFLLTFESLQTVAYQKLAQSWGKSTHLTLFKMEPLRGIGVLEISSPLGLCMVDRQMGGPGQAVQMEQEISEIEKVLLEQAAQQFLEEWCGRWSTLKELKPVILGYESNGSFIRTIPTETIMLVVCLAAAFGENKGRIQLGVPFAGMEPLIYRHCQGAEAGATQPPPTPAPPAGPCKWNPCFNEVSVQVTAEWDGLEMTPREILALKIGDMLPMAPHLMQRLNVRVADAVKFHGRPGMLDGNWAVELTQPVNP